MSRRYLSDIIGDGYVSWGGKKVFIKGPTGIGKSHFIVEKYLSYIIATRAFRDSCKILILCNRKLLREQYWHDVIRRYDSYSEVMHYVEISTYQKLAADIVGLKSVDGLFCEFDTIICDEAHYFYADADFNPFGTYVLLNAIVRAGISKTMIFMSATLEPAEKLIRNSIIEQYYLAGETYDVRSEWTETLSYDLSCLSGYGRFKCLSVPDMETLCEILVSSEKKSVVFIDNREEAARMEKILREQGDFLKSDITLLNSDNIDDRSLEWAVAPLVMTNKVIPKILITTSVLDNGVSIHDEDVGNVVIITESKVSFLQMLGRVRGDYNSCDLNLVFMERKSGFFQKRKEQYEELMSQIEEIEKNTPGTMVVMNEVWADGKKAEVFKKILVPCVEEADYLPSPGSTTINLEQLNLELRYGNTKFLFNTYGKEKIGDMLIAESRLYEVALTDPVNAIFLQMSWIDKNPEDLERKISTHLQKQLESFKSDLLRINSYRKEELIEAKQNLCKKYRKDFFSDVVTKDGSFATRKFEAILTRFGFAIDKKTIEGKTLYSVIKKGR